MLASYWGFSPISCLLAYFKYANFFLENIAVLAGTVPRRLEIVLPLGISFFTFKSLSYTIDVYRGDLPHVSQPVALRHVRVLFPRPDRWAHRACIRLFSSDEALATAVLATDRRGLPDDPPRTHKEAPHRRPTGGFRGSGFRRGRTYSPLTVWSAVIAYSLQIYCDFSGYSDMAIGVSKIIGIDLPENFNMPYLAVSPLDFWRRWHITLSNWLSDYLYYSAPNAT